MHRRIMLRIPRSRRVLWVCLATTLGLLILWSGQAMAAEPKRGGTLRVAYGNRLTHLDFHTAAGYEMMWVAMNIGCGLVNITPDQQFVGDAATAWEFSEDGLTYTFTDNSMIYKGL